MIIVNHRINTIEKLKVCKKNLGCEIDIRNHGKNLILNHDAFDENGDNFEKWLDYYQHKFLIINVKEEGLESKIFNILRKKNITKYFILDETMPFILKYANMGHSDFALRISEIENYLTAIKIKNFLKNKKKIKWIWLDTFSTLPISKGIFNTLKKNKYKICLVSPELHFLNDRKKWTKLIDNFQKKLVKDKLKPDMVCTNNPNKWLDFKEIKY